MKNSTATTTNKNAVLLIAALVSFLTPFMSSSVNVAIPSIGKEFAMDAVLLSWVSTSYAISSVVFLLPFGRIADMYGRKKILTYGILVFTASSVLIGISGSTLTLLLFRITQGIGSALIFGTGIALITSVFPAGERGKALGIYTTTVYLGLSLGPFLGGLLTQHFGWRSVFLAIVPPGMVVIIAIFWKLKGEWIGTQERSLDLPGSLLYGISIVALLYGFSILPAILGISLVVVSVGGIWGFITWETKAKSPIFDMGLFKNNVVFAFSTLAAFINYSATFAVTFLLSLYLQYVRDYSAQEAGVILISMPVLQAIFSPIIGRLSDRVEPRILASAGMGVTAITLFLLIFLSQQTPISYVVFILIMLGTGLALFSSPNANAIMGSVDRKFYGVASASLSGVRQIGMTFSMGIAMLILNLFMGRAAIAPEVFPLFLASMRTAFIIFTALCFAGIFASYARGRIRERRQLQNDRPHA